jgi:hypothetical protein
MELTLTELELATHHTPDTLPPLRRQVQVIALLVQVVPDRMAIANTKFLAREHRIEANATIGHRAKNVRRV